MNYFFIPGNPPAAYFYQQWGEEIVRAQPGASFTVSHYPDLERIQDPRLALQKVCMHHLEQLKSFRQSQAGPLIIMGHSLGGHFALRLLELAPEMVARAILFHPFLRAPSMRAQLLLKGLAALYEKEKFQQGIVRVRKGLELLNADLPHVTDAEIFRSFHLARHEHFTIAQDKSFLEIPHSLREKIVVFHARQDDWCSAAVVAQLKTQVRTYACTEPHGFVTQKRHRLNLFDQLKAISID